MKYPKHLVQRMLLQTGLDLPHAMRLICNLSDCKKKLTQSGELRPYEDAQTYELGLKRLCEHSESPPFQAAAEFYCAEHDPDNRPRTVDERRQIFCRMQKAVPEWSLIPLSEWDSERCRSLLLQTFPTKRGRNKGFGKLDSLFRYAIAHRWCTENPMRALHHEKIEEPEIAILSMPQLEALLTAASSMGYQHCAPAVGLMLWAGIRPQEVARLCWGDIDLQEQVIYIKPQHSKTGGARCCTIQPILLRWLRRFRPKEVTTDTTITPAKWTRLWRDLRLESQLCPWVNDTLRHSFASYYLKHFGDLEQLRLEMGHSNTHQLQTRYLNMRGLTAAAASDFWAGRFGKLHL